MMRTVVAGILILMSKSFFGQGPITQICLVSVDTTFSHVIVVWEKDAQTSFYPIEWINIYRQQGTGDSLIAQVHWDSLSEYHDYDANPNLKPHRYRISGTNVNGLEGPKSFPHQTIHFAVLDPGTGNLQLKWTPYVGYAIANYNCWIDSAQGNLGWQWVNTTQSATDTSWWDNNAPSLIANFSYLVDVTWDLSCSASKIVDHNNTRSNKGIVENFENGLSNKSLYFNKLYPNPSTKEITAVLSSLSWQPIEIILVDLNGNSVYQHPIFKAMGRHEIVINLNDIPAGIYCFRLVQGTQVFAKPIIKL